MLGGKGRRRKLNKIFSLHVGFAFFFSSEGGGKVVEVNVLCKVCDCDISAEPSNGDGWVEVATPIARFDLFVIGKKVAK